MTTPIPLGAPHSPTAAPDVATKDIALEARVARLETMVKLFVQKSHVSDLRAEVEMLRKQLPLKINNLPGESFETALARLTKMGIVIPGPVNEYIERFKAYTGANEKLDVQLASMPKV